jgi:hypothetical protein
MAKKKVPKRIAGVKVPKAVRRSPWTRMIIGNKATRTVLNDALFAAAGAAAVVLTRRSLTSVVAYKAGDAVLKAGNELVHTAFDRAEGTLEALGQAAADATTSVLRKSNTGRQRARDHAEPPARDQGRPGPMSPGRQG